MDLPILYEDADIVAVAKPSGLLTHRAPPKPGEGGQDGRTKEETAEDWFKEKYQGLALPERPYVHRLDRDTSGVLVFAKNPAAYEFLRKAFHDRGVKKTYLAITYGAPKAKSGAIDFDIGRSRQDFRLRSAQPKAKGRLRDALTKYEVLGEFKDTDAGSTGEYALMRLSPETGRTHQIRVHLKAIHHPIVGDALYAPNRPPAFGIRRLALHAYSLDLPLPSGGRTIVSAPVPGDLVPAFLHFTGAREMFALL